MTLTGDMLRRIRRIELVTRKLADEVFMGAYHAVFKGRGIAFDSVRPYEPGDDVRSIDWNVTARTGEPFIKQYTEERELTVLLLLDVSASGSFGTQGRFKREVAVEIAAALAYAAIRNQDRVGLLMVSDQIEGYIPPRKGRNHILRLIRDLLTLAPAGRGTDLGLGLRTANRLLSRRAILFLVSDFLTEMDYTRELTAAAAHHDVIAIVTGDRLEMMWPDVGLVALTDAETGQTAWADTRSARWRADFEAYVQSQRAERQAMLKRASVDWIEIATDGDYAAALAAFFQARARRRL
jgi:uncharacterized protein (DUF58 family)